MCTSAASGLARLAPPPLVGAAAPRPAPTPLVCADRNPYTGTPPGMALPHRPAIAPAIASPVHPVAPPTTPAPIPCLRRVIPRRPTAPHSAARVVPADQTRTLNPLSDLAAIPTARALVASPTDPV